MTGSRTALRVGFLVAFTLAGGCCARVERVGVDGADDSGSDTVFDTSREGSPEVRSEPPADMTVDFTSEFGGGGDSGGGGIGAACMTHGDCSTGNCCFSFPCGTIFGGTCLPGVVFNGCCVTM